MVITTEGRLREGCPMKKHLTITAVLIALAVIAIVTFSSPPEVPPAVPPATCDVPSSISIPDVRTTAPAAPLAELPQGNHSHAYAGLPRSTRPVRVLKNAGFIVGYSDARRNPLWVSYRVFKIDTPTTHKRPSRFQADDRTQARVKHDDYTRSGYDRGHMAPIRHRHRGGVEAATILEWS